MLHPRQHQPRVLFQSPPSRPPTFALWCAPTPGIARRLWQWFTVQRPRTLRRRKDASTERAAVIRLPSGQVALDYGRYRSRSGEATSGRNDG